MHGAAPPDTDERDDELRRFPHQRRDAVTLFDAQVGEGHGEPARAVLQLAEGQLADRAVGFDDREGDRVGGVSIAEEFGDARVGIGEGGEQVLDELGCGGFAGDHDSFHMMCLATPTNSPFWLCACTAAKILCPSSDSPCLV